MLLVEERKSPSLVHPKPKGHLDPVRKLT